MSRAGRHRQAGLDARAASRAPAGRRQQPASAWLAAVVLVAGCAGGPPPPDWQQAARAALDAASAADLRGDDRIAGLEFDRARAQIARTGRPDLLARAELLRCAGRVASLELAPCAGFERLRADAAAAELAYAEHLAGRRLTKGLAALLPSAQQPVAALVASAQALSAPTSTGTAPAAATATATTAADAAAAARLLALDDPLSRLVGAAVLLQAGQAGPQVAALAVDTASAQGWRRPLLAWLGLQRQRALAAGDAEAAARLQRRMDLVAGPR